MRVISFIIILSLIFIQTAFAVIPIYCPEEKIHLYDYQYDVIVKNAILAKDFKPTYQIPQPKETDDFVCPLCHAPLNGWEYMGRKYKSFTNVCGVVSLLTKDELGFKWIPYDVPETEYTREK